MTLLDVILDDFEKCHGFRLAYKAEHAQEFEKAKENFSFKIRRMWNLYIQDPQEIERGLDLGYFLRPQILNRYAIRTPSVDTKTGKTRGNVYRCENSVGVPGCSNAGEYLELSVDYAPKPCSLCSGRLIRDDKFEEMYLELRENKHPNWREEFNRRHPNLKEKFQRGSIQLPLINDKESDALDDNFIGQ